MIKKLISILVLIVMVFSLAACNQDAQLKYGKYMNEDSSVGIELCDGYYLLHISIQSWHPSIEELTYRIKDGILILSFCSEAEFLFAIDEDTLIFIYANEVDEHNNRKIDPVTTAHSHFFGQVLRYVGN